MKRNTILFVLAICITPGMVSQIDITGKLKEKTEARLEQRTDEAIEKGLDKTEEGPGNMVKKEKGEEEEGEKRQKEANDSEKREKENTNVKDTIKPGLVGTTQYDFIPGDQILLFEDFSQDQIGEFPALWTTNGSGEVKTLNIFLTFYPACFCITLPVHF